MADQALRQALKITAAAYASRRDHDGTLIANVLDAVVRTAAHLDVALEVGPEKPQRKSHPSKER